MNNLFKKGFASLALASAMTSGIFAGNAAYIDIKIKYLSGKDKAVLGATDNKKERVELLVSVLDKDGAYATKGADGKADIVDMTTSSKLEVVAAIYDGQITRDLSGKKNINRYVFDYSDANSTRSLTDVITFTSGAGDAQVQRKINIDLVSVDAKGLIVRATSNSDIKTLSHVNLIFSDISVNGEDKNLSDTSSKAPGGLVGLTIPIKVYASTFANNNSYLGDFTLAPNLEDEIIVVTPLADTNNNSVPNFALPSIELTMKNGQASGEIMMTRGMPAGNDVVGIAVAPNDGKFESALTEGLGISFLVYVKGTQKINNYEDATATVDFTDDYSFDKNLTEDQPSTDTIQMISGVPASLKVGSYNMDTGKWENTSSVISILDGNDTTIDRGVDGPTVEANATHEAIATLTVVDSYGNPAIARATVTSKVKFGSETTSKLIKVSSADVAVNANSGISTITVNIADSYDTNNTKTIKTIKTTIDASNRVLAALDPVDLTIRTLPLIEVSIDGGVKLKKAIKDVNTSLNLTGITPLETAAANILKITEADYTVVIKGIDIDGNNTDNNGSLGVYIVDNSGENEYLSGSDLKKYIVGVTGVELGTSTLTIVDKTSDNYYRLDIDANGTTEGNFTIEINNSATINIANIVIEGYQADDIGEEDVTIKIPNLEDKKVNAFVEFSINDADYPKEVAIPGSKLNFKFSGVAVNEGDTVVIELNSSGLTSASGANTAATTVDNNHTEGTIALVGGTATKFTSKITTTLPKDGMVSVILRDVNRTDDGYYGIKTVTINGVRPVFMYLNEDKDTDDIIELKEAATIIMSRLEDQDITSVSVALITNGDGDGSEDEKRKSLPDTLEASKKPLSTDKEVLTGLYYDIFKEATDIKFADKYGNEIDGLKDDIKKDVTFSYTDGIEFDNDGGDSWIKFKDSAAATEKKESKETLTVSFKKADGSLVSNTITWTKIKLSKKNSGFIITDHNGGFKDPNTGIFDVVDSEIVIKVIGNGNQKQSSTKIALTHSVEGAKVRLTKVSDVGEGSFTNALSGLTSSITTKVEAGGSYYVVSADTAGVLTITVSSKVKDDKDNDVPISATHKITFDEIDLDKPMVVESGVVASNGQISIEVTDKNLNTVDTLVTVSDINDHNIITAVYTDGKYIAKVANAGIYQVEVLGVDMAQNKQRFNFTRKMGDAGTLEDALVAHGSYVIDGTFASHDFEGVDSAFDWVYTQGKVMNQLNAKDSTDKSAFKWGEVKDITVGTDNMWYMISLTGSAGSIDAKGAYGWVLINPNGDTFKLASANKNGTFKFSDALYVKGTISGSKVTFAKR